MHRAEVELETPNS
uniref:Uncharacterized protein n=1 Tax=Arundo donax TaxID=35708 RepID=A0A0A9B324_ARUDO